MATLYWSVACILMFACGAPAWLFLGCGLCAFLNLDDDT